LVYILIFNILRVIRYWFTWFSASKAFITTFCRKIFELNVFAFMLWRHVTTWSLIHIRSIVSDMNARHIYHMQRPHIDSFLLILIVHHRKGHWHTDRSRLVIYCYILMLRWVILLFFCTRQFLGIAHLLLLALLNLLLLKHLK